jgi:nitrate ABC transporter ATP-binding subunit
MVDPIVELFNLTKAFPTPSGPLEVVTKFNLRVQKGEFVSLIGHSGCGKSTVLNMVAGLIDKTDGGIVVGNREVTGTGLDRGMVFQAPSLLPWLSALENVRIAVAQSQPHLPLKAQREKALHYLNLVGLSDSSHKRPRELSNGMRQRVGIARAFAINPKVMLLDEPFGMLDPLTRMELQDVLIELFDCEGMTGMMVTHDVDEALFLSDRVIMMTNGPRATVGGILEVKFPRPRIRADVLEHPDFYTLREQLIMFLEDQDHRKHSAA